MNIYDFDKTIYEDDSSIDFFKFCLSKNKKILLTLPQFFLTALLYLLKFKDKEELKSSFFSFIKYFDNINKIAEEFWQFKNYELKQFYIKKHKKSDIIISASPVFLLEPIAKKYSFRIVATNVNTKTGALIGKNCYGQEKVNRIHKIGIYSCEEFYSDSLSDTPMSKIAKKAFIIKGEDTILWNDYVPSTFNRIKEFFINRDFFTFIFLGFINAINGVLFSFIYSKFITNPILAFIAGFITSLCFSYLLNSKLNFKQPLNIKSAFKFFLSNIPNFIIQCITVVVLINIWNWRKLFAYSVASVIAVPITFGLVKVGVFKSSKKS